MTGVDSGLVVASIERRMGSAPSVSFGPLQTQHGEGWRVSVGDSWLEVSPGRTLDDALFVFWDLVALGGDPTELR